jgi:hypothetical protein
MSIEPSKHLRIWIFECPFTKHGTPVLGSFGSTIRNVVVIPVEAWTALCRDIPELGRYNFEVGSHD